MSGYKIGVTYREPPDPPDLRPAAVAAVARAKDIETRLLAAMARGEQPAPAVLAEALHAAAALLLLVMEIHERAELLHAQLVTAEHRRAALSDAAQVPAASPVSAGPPDQSGSPGR